MFIRHRDNTNLLNVIIDSFYSLFEIGVFSDLAPSKKVTGGERQKAKGKRQNG
jgi:hypothetical protein